MNDNIQAFTVRVPKPLLDQIEARAKVNKRNRNQEINMILEKAIDVSVAADLQVMSKTAGQSPA